MKIGNLNNDKMSNNLIKFICGIADNNLILAERIGQLCGHGPSLETDIALTNIALDLLGQIRSYYQYAAQLTGGDATEDTIAMLRKEHEYLNVHLVEQPNTDFAYVIARQFLFDVFHLALLQKLQYSSDNTLAAIATKAIKEVSYHKRFSSDWVKRLGDGTDESHNRMQDAFNNLWTYTNELFQMTEADMAMVNNGIGVDVSLLKKQWLSEVTAVLEEATLKVPDLNYFQKGGKEGYHTEHMGYILTDLQYMQRTYPNMTW